MSLLIPPPVTQLVTCILLYPHSVEKRICFSYVYSYTLCIIRTNRVRIFATYHPIHKVTTNNPKLEFCPVFSPQPRFESFPDVHLNWTPHLMDIPFPISWRQACTDTSVKLFFLTPIRNPVLHALSSQNWLISKDLKRFLLAAGLHTFVTELKNIRTPKKVLSGSHTFSHDDERGGKRCSWRGFIRYQAYPPSNSRIERYCLFAPLFDVILTCVSLALSAVRIKVLNGRYPFVLSRHERGGKR